jgi:hypothetical protein
MAFCAMNEAAIRIIPARKRIAPHMKAPLFQNGFGSWQDDYRAEGMARGANGAISTIAM